WRQARHLSYDAAIFAQFELGRDQEVRMVDIFIRGDCALRRPAIAARLSCLGRCRYSGLGWPVAFFGTRIN
ncbi:MAG: hypothetical protein KGJ60_15720, partial [Verrucomicrobiota bacterium]|nr:hypothetical protein [Verrucomicrobiota bacterium]